MPSNKRLKEGTGRKPHAYDVTPERLATAREKIAGPIRKRLAEINLELQKPGLSAEAVAKLQTERTRLQTMLK